MSIEAAFFGVLARDAEHKVSKGGRSYLHFSCRTGDGDDVQWVSVTCFDEKAIAQSDKLVKGSRVYIEGSLKLEEWTKDGIQRHGLSCMAWRAHLAEIGRNRPKREAAPAPDKPQSAAAPNDFHDDALPF